MPVRDGKNVGAGAARLTGRTLLSIPRCGAASHTLLCKQPEGDVAMDQRGSASEQEHPTSGQKSTQRWWVVGIEGIAALAIGIFIVAKPADASDIIRLLIAAGLLGISLAQIVESFRFWERPGASWAMLGGGLGLAAALLTLFASYSVNIPPAGARQILALGLMAFGIIGVIGLLVGVVRSRSSGFKIATLIIDILAIAVGALLYLAEEHDTERTQLLGVAGIVGGAVLLLYAYMLWRPARVVVTSPAADA